MLDPAQATTSRGTSSEIPVKVIEAMLKEALLVLLALLVLPIIQLAVLGGKLKIGILKAAHPKLFFCSLVPKRRMQVLEFDPRIQRPGV